MILMAIIKWVAQWGRSQILREHPEKQNQKQNLVGDQMCFAQGRDP